ARRAQLPGITAAGKTGTTQAYRDAWFIGYTGRFTASVWFGNDDFTSTNNLTGGRLPAMTWQAIMDAAHRGLSPPLMPGVDVEIEDRPELIVATRQERIDPDADRDLSSELTTVLRGVARRFEVDAPSGGELSSASETSEEAIGTFGDAALQAPEAVTSQRPN
ncbi:MAG: hypothetical protein KI785_02795, partial [Devosiaceae bacterium]|nr:hypothetical protein [Devosiaceae bacterium MH13]